MIPIKDSLERKECAEFSLVENSLKLLLVFHMKNRRPRNDFHLRLLIDCESFRNGLPAGFFGC